METTVAKVNFLLKRGTRYYIRVRVPNDLLAHYHPKKEIVQSLNTSDYAEACRLVREKAIALHNEFDRRRAGGTISDKEAEFLCRRMVESRLAADEQARVNGSLLDDAGYELHELINQQNQQGAKEALARGRFDNIKAQAADWLTSEGYNLPLDSEPFKRFVMMFAKAFAEANKLVALRDEGEPVDTPKAKLPDVAEAIQGVPTLGQLVKRFLDKADQSKPMFKKYNAVLPLFLEVVGDKKVDQLKQIDIEDFCHLICKLPPRWNEQVRQKKISVRKLAQMDHPKTISPKTYEDTYIASVRPFLNEAIRVFGDQGFPRHLTTDGIGYSGKQKAGENKQRPLTTDEIKKLFESDHLTKAKADQAKEHEFWFPLVGLYTGARVNEVCQLNPQSDIKQEFGVWCFEFTDEGETDDRVTKSVKNSTSKRVVPIHDKLIELGFLDYVERIKKTGAKLLFPQWVPSGGKASAGAEEWFRELLKVLKLRDDTPGKRVVGYHVFRFTMENRALNLEVANIRLIVGHAGDKTTVERGYEGEADVMLKKRIMDRIWFDLSFH